ncbi:MAG: alpha/beta hydrolase [Clostridia bacterium]|nr:alpha/beta hydrolase [Clostridia bacterium]
MNPGDFHLHYVEKGAGEPLILLHGNGEDSAYFVHQIEYFSPHYRVIAVDTRGHGQSPRGSAPFTIRQFAEDLLAFMDERAIARAHILGFSDGGNIAMIFALRHPERVNRLVLNGANLNARGVKPLVQLPIEIGYHIARCFAEKSPEARRNAEMLGLMVNDPNVSPEALEALHVPTLVIAGTRDMIRTAHTRLIAERLPDAELVLLPGDHFIANRQHEVFNRAVERFLRA